MLNKKRIILYWLIGLVLLSLIILFVYKYRIKLGRVASPFFMALFITYVITPIVNRLQKRNLSRSISILLIYAVLLIVVGVTAVFVVPELINNTKELLTTLPDIATRYQGIFNDIISNIKSSRLSQDIKDVLFIEINNTTAAVQTYAGNMLKNGLSELVETITMFFDFTLALVIAYYFIKDSDFFVKAFYSLTPRKWRVGLSSTGKEVNAVLTNFIQGQMLTAMIVGVLETIILLVTGTKYAIVLGLFSGLCNIIPYFGPIIGAVPAGAVAMIDSPMKAVWVVAGFSLVQQIDNSFISPKVIEGRLGLHPVTTILAVLIGGQFFGIIGMLISVPIAAILKIIFKRIVTVIV